MGVAFGCFAIACAVWSLSATLTKGCTETAKPAAVLCVAFLVASVAVLVLK